MPNICELCVVFSVFTVIISEYAAPLQLEPERVPPAHPYSSNDDCPPHELPPTATDDDVRSESARASSCVPNNICIEDRRPMLKDQFRLRQR